MAASVQIEDGSLTVKVAICSMSHMNPEIISVETVSHHDPILEDIAAKNPVPWRVPIPTDVLLARLAESVGFDEVEIWAARDLRPRNVTSGSARESIVVARRSA